MLATTTALALPTIHLNGTGAKSLVDEYHAVYLATSQACDALAAATCNARDFYPQSSGDIAWQQARNERAEMFQQAGGGAGIRRGLDGAGQRSSLTPGHRGAPQ